MVASAVFILDLKGKVIISRNYRGDVPMCSPRSPALLHFPLLLCPFSLLSDTPGYLSAQSD